MRYRKICGTLGVQLTARFQMLQRYQKTHRWLLLLLSLAAVVDAAPANDPIEIFITSATEVSGLKRLRDQLPNAQIKVHRIDGIEQIKAILNHDIPGQTKAAKRLALRRLKTFGKREQQQLQQAARALLRAQKLGVERYPAIVFDRRFVVYGVTDLTRAYALFREQREGKSQ